jgi:hypothetical protein
MSLRNERAILHSRGLGAVRSRRKERRPTNSFHGMDDFRLLLLCPFSEKLAIRGTRLLASQPQTFAIYRLSRRRCGPGLLHGSGRIALRHGENDTITRVARSSALLWRSFIGAACTFTCSFGVVEWVRRFRRFITLDMAQHATMR